MIQPVDYAPSQRFGENPTRNLPANDWIIQAFGNYQPDGHTGVDYPCPVGTQVRAVTGGTVLHVGWMAGTYADNPWWINPGFAGYVYVVDHGSFIGIYGHCKDASNWVNKGDRVSEGQTLGLSGNTGASTGPHLHFEALPDGYVLNSYMYGRIDPQTLFGSLSYASESITPLSEEDDDLTPDQFNQLVGKLDELNAAHHVATREHVNGKVKDIARAVVTEPVPYKDPVTGQDTGQTTTLATIAGYADFQAVQTRLTQQGPTVIAAQIDAAGLAQQVRDELIKLLEGK